jgi:hypothetical protein
MRWKYCDGTVLMLMLMLMIMLMLMLMLSFGRACAAKLVPLCRSYKHTTSRVRIYSGYWRVGDAHARMLR